MRVGVLIDGTIAVWQRRALELACRDHEIFLLRSNGWTPQRRARHALYYALNLFTVRNRLTRQVDLLPQLKIVDTCNFQPGFDGAWAVLPDHVVDWARANKLDAIVKFGLGLLRVPPPEKLPIPILSFHHGDPRQFRGRPAGFYELQQREPFMGQIVQAIGAKLDAGTVYAFAESRVVPHSYRQTLLESFSLSPNLLLTALKNVETGRTIDFASNGRNYRLPGTATVLRFVSDRWVSAARRLIYGAFIEKRWRVATAEIEDATDPIAAVREAERGDWKRIDLVEPYVFYADPFYGADSSVLVEAFNRRTGKGEIVRVSGGKHVRLEGFAGHVSYPATVEVGGRSFLIPETSGWGRLTAYEIEGETARVTREIAIDESRIIDPTFLHHDGRIYLFGNTVEDGTSILHLWHAEDLFAPFAKHPASPIRASARGSRMAGNLEVWNGRLYRLGQDCRESYGNGILAFEVRELSPTAYEEELIGDARFERARGPHTFNRRGNQILFDYYDERVSLLAGVRRVLNKL